ncbi:MAG: nuclear transport factor 2 family protein [Vitreoscilla sp.]
MPTSHTIAERYLAAWNEPDAARRAALIAALWSPQGRYADPLMSGQGHDGITRMIEAARAQFPGLVFTPRGEPDGHGEFARFSWSLGPAGGAPVAGGTDVARLDEAGRVVEVIGFLDATGRVADVVDLLG